MMIVNDSNFRELHRNLVVLKGDWIIKDLKNHIDFPESCDSILTFCYIDEDAGMTFDLLCMYNYSKDEHYEIDNKHLRQIYRKEAVNECEMKIFLDKNYKNEKFLKYINDTINIYENNEKLNFTRKMEDIDHLREKNYPDDILVIIYKENINPEAIWVRLAEVKDGILFGKLLNEPNSDFGIHFNDIISINFYKDEENIIRAIYCK
jgi:hypothetical protein